MQITAALLIPALLIYLGIPTALFGILEYFLARTESPWPGRVLPILSALCSVGGDLLLLFNLASQNLPAAFLSLAGSLLILNIPTLVFLLIYRTARKRFIEKKDLDKMNIQDL